MGVPDSAAEVGQDTPSEPQKPTTGLRDLRRAIGWLDAEIAAVKKGANPRKRRKLRLARLKRLFGRSRYNLRQLLYLREKQKALLRIRVLQKGRERRRKRYKEVNQKLGSDGPKILAGRGPKVLVEPEMEGKIEEFWKGIWEIRGACDSHQKEVDSWVNLMRSREVGGEEQLDPDSAFATALRKMKSWKAPGPDGIPAFWLKAFGGMAQVLREKLAEIIDKQGGGT